MDIMYGFHVVSSASAASAATDADRGFDLCVVCRQRHLQGVLLLPQLSQVHIFNAFRIRLLISAHFDSYRFFVRSLTRAFTHVCL